MTVKIDTSGLDKFRKKIAEAAKPEKVSLPELMPESFMHTYTKFDSLQAMFDAANVESPEYLQSEEWNVFVRENTQFNNWSEMLQEAGALRAKKKLNL